MHPVHPVLPFCLCNPGSLSPQILAIFTRLMRRKRACEAGRVWRRLVGLQHRRVVGWEAGQVGCVYMYARAEVGSG